MRGPRLSSRAEVLKEIRGVYRHRVLGALDDDVCRARIYTLQTMLRALKLAEKEPKKDDSARARYLNYELTPEQHAAMFKAQDGKCAICEQAKRLFVDHHHGTGKVRGLLCPRCNGNVGVLEGWFVEYGTKAQEYLARNA